jgi:hypothetical protein
MTRDEPGTDRGEAAVSAAVALTPDVGPSWLRPLVDNVGQIPDAFRRRLPADVLAMVTAAKAASSIASIGGGSREAAVLVLFSGPEAGPATAVSPTMPTCC